MLISGIILFLTFVIFILTYFPKGELSNLSSMDLLSVKQYAYIFVLLVLLFLLFIIIIKAVNNTTNFYKNKIKMLSFSLHFVFILALSYYVYGLLYLNSAQLFLHLYFVDFHTFNEIDMIFNDYVNLLMNGVEPSSSLPLMGEEKVVCIQQGGKEITYVNWVELIYQSNIKSYVKKAVLLGKKFIGLPDITCIEIDIF